MKRSLLALALLAASGAAAGSAADDPLGRVVTLPPTPGPHEVWLGDMVLQRTALFDGDDGRMLGMLSAGAGIVAPAFSVDGREIYLPETYYSRGTRGERTDVVTVYDAATLSPVAEIALPPKRADYASAVASNAVSDDGRFLALFYLTPATSLGIVDLRERRVTAEIDTPGCGLVYGAGARRFLMLCGDGALLSVTVDDTGRERSKERSAVFFDPVADPVFDKAARAGHRWLFVTFSGRLHAVDVSGPSLRFEAPWPLFGEAELRDGWKVGGQQPFAAHAASDRLYALVHQGGEGSHKDPGREVWVFDLAARARAARLALASPYAGLLRGTLRLDEATWGGWLATRLLYALLPNPGADRILVTKDAAPLLFTGTMFPSTLLVHDARSGELLRDVSEVGVAGGLLSAP